MCGLGIEKMPREDQTRILSKSDFVELIGVRPSAISNYIARGQIYGDALPARVGSPSRSRKCSSHSQSTR
jgi:hypothetical protein